jgi:FRG domain
VARTRQTRWSRLGVQRRVTSVRDLLRDVATVTVATGHRYVWRGVRDAHYLLHSSLHRRLLITKEEVTVANLVHRESELLRRARAAGLHNHEGRQLADADLLALLQHAGASTTLLDVTPDPFIALFFATEPVGEVKPCALMGIKVPGTTQAIQANHTFQGPLPDPPIAGRPTVAVDGIYACLRSELGLPDNLKAPLLWEAPFVDNRMRAQRGMFLATAAPPNALAVASFELPLGTPTEEALRAAQLFQHGPGLYTRPSVVVFYLSVELRLAAARELDKRFGYRTETIYPDLAGFALANASNRGY